jgi:hypothetical protein
MRKRHSRHGLSRTPSALASASTMFVMSQGASLARSWPAGANPIGSGPMQRPDARARACAVLLTIRRHAVVAELLLQDECP